jgi:hypothetical protein
MDNTIIVSIFTSGAMLLAHNHLISLRNAGYTNTISYCTNQLLCDKLNKQGFKTEYLDEIDKEEYFKFNSSEFNEFSYIRFKIILDLLKTYEKVWYLDVDTVILGDIWSAIDTKEDWDIQFQDDCMLPCTGNILARNTSYTKILLDNLYKSKNKEWSGQMYLSTLIKEEKIKMPIKIKIMSLFTFCPGILYFPDEYLIPLQDEEKKERDAIKQNFADVVKKKKLSKPVLIHANYIITRRKKINALKQFKLWYI